MIHAALKHASPFLADRLETKIGQYAAFVSEQPAPARGMTLKGELAMGDKGKRDKGNREERKKPKLNIKEKRKQKREQDKNKTIPSTIPLTGA